MDIPDGGDEMVLTLPPNIILTGVSAHPSTTMPRTTVRLLARSTGGLGAAYLGVGVGYAIGTTTFGYTWTGELALPSDYENEVKANIFNRTGATVRWGLIAWWREP